MDTPSVFQFSAYKSAMKHFLREGQRGALSRAAQAMGCQVSYLSRVMNSELHLTPDQAFLLAQHLRFPARERRYFQTLVEWERAASPAYREHLGAEIKELRRQHEDLKERAKRPEPAAAYATTYFSAWQWCAVHMLTSTPDGQTAAQLAERLGLPRAQAQYFLEGLASWGLVRRNGAKWQYASGEMHLPKESPLVVFHHQNWRSRAVQSAQQPGTDNIHFTNVQTLSRADWPLLKELFLRFISDCNALMGPSPPEEGVAITCDLFRL